MQVKAITPRGYCKGVVRAIEMAKKAQNEKKPIVILAVIGNYPLAAGILILYVIITVVRNSVEPRIVGKQIGLHPLLTLIAMFTGVSLAGLPGLILLPMAVMIFVNMEKNGAIHIFGGVKEENRQERA